MKMKTKWDETMAIPKRRYEFAADNVTASPGETLPLGTEVEFVGMIDQGAYGMAEILFDNRQLVVLRDSLIPA